jgi:hemoglobin
MGAQIDGRRIAVPLGALVLLGLAQANAHSQTVHPQKPAGPAELLVPLPLSPENEAWLDHDIYQVLRTVINTGADLYNQEFDRAGCYRLYQGSLLTLHPLLSHHPDLQKAIDAGLADAASKPSVAARAFALRAVLDEIRSKLKPGVAHTKEPPRASEAKPLPAAPPKEAAAEPKKAPSKGKSLWERLGGEAGVVKIVDEWVGLAATDSKANFTRGGKFKPSAPRIAELKKLLVAYLSEQIGGPLKYSGKTMKTAHKGMGITDTEFSAFIADLRNALAKLHVSSADAEALVKVAEDTRKDIVEGGR